MSAAEKLERLYATPEAVDTVDEWNGAIVDWSEAVYEVFPEIIAVVKAAEVFWSTDVVDGMAATEELDRALSALDEKLGDVTP